MKYVIKNCENLHFDKYCSFSDTEYCKDRSNCLIKQIVELCKEPFNNFDLDDTRIQDKKFYAHLLLMPILKLLEIEVVE